MENGRLLHIVTATLVETTIQEIVCPDFVSTWEVTLYHGAADLKRAYCYRQQRQNIMQEAKYARKLFSSRIYWNFSR